MAVLLAALGAALGSFIVTVVDRLEQRTSWIKGRSCCEVCRRSLAPWELVPIVSFVLLRGRCRTCSARISYWHIGAEVGLAALFVLAYVAPPELGPRTLPMLLALLVLLVGLFVSDVRHGTLPDLLSLTAISVALVGAWLDGQLLSAFIGAAVGAVFFGAQHALSRGRWVGSGDIRLGALAGSLLGWPYLLLALLVAYVGGAFISLALIATKKVSFKSTVPMGAFLLPAVLVVQWVGAAVLRQLFP